MVNSARFLDCLAAAYRLDLDDAEYVRNIADEAAPLLDRGLGVLAYTYEAEERDNPAIDHFATSERFDASWLPRFYAEVEAAGHPTAPQPTGFHAWRHMTCGQASAVEGMRPFLPLFTHIGGARDTFAVNALDASGRGLWIGAPMRTTRKVSPEQVLLFTRFAAHLTSAVRLRQNAGRLKPRAAAVLSPSGELLHAEASPGVVEAREELRNAALAFDEARTKKVNAEVATRRWRPLVESRWTLIDEFESDGKRLVVAIENGPPTRPPRKDLSLREHQVMTQAHLGHDNKVIAYELGLTHSTVRVLLHRAATKLGASSRQEAIDRFDALVCQVESEKAQD